MWNDLHRLAKILAAPFLLDHRLVNLAGSKVVSLAHLGAGEALIMPKIKVGFGAVLGNKHLTVLERAHRSGINVDVGIELDVGDFDAAGFKDRAQRRSGDAFPERGHHTAGNEDIFSHEDICSGKVEL